MADHGEKNFFDSSNLDEFLYFEHGEITDINSSSDEESEEEEDTVEQDIINQLRDITTSNLANDSISTSSDEEVIPDNDMELEPVQPVDHKQTSKCTCAPATCISLLTDEEVVKARALAQAVRALGKVHFDLMVLGKLSVTLINTNKVSTTSHKSKDRLKSRSEYMHEGKLVHLSHEL